MDFLNQATGQLRELLQSMTPAARVTALLLLSVIGVSLGYLVQHQSSGPDSYLFNGEFLPSSVVDGAHAAIAQAGLEGAVREGNRIKIPSGRKSEFLAAVADAGALPPNFHKIVEDALDVSPFASSDVRRGKYKAGREQQLSMLVSEMDGIEQANVMFDIHEARGFGKKSQATATVSIRPAAGATLDMRRVKMIQKAVAGGVAELQPHEVVVTNSADGSSFDMMSGVSADSFENEYYQTRLAFERNMQSKIEHILRFVPGVRVEVTAELEETLEHTTQALTPEDEPVSLSTSEQTESDTVSEIENRGRPGLTAQGPQRGQADQDAVTVKNERTVENKSSQFFSGNKREFTRKAVLVPNNVRASIAVPRSYLLSVWRERERLKGNDPDQPLPNDIDTRLESIEGAEKENIKNALVPLLPKELAKDNRSGIEVVYFESLTPDPIEAPSTASTILGWASKNFNTMTMAVVALVSLMMLRSMVKSIPNAEPAEAIRAPTLAVDTTDGPTSGEGSEGADSSDEAQRPRLRLKKGDSLKDDLVEIVREDPDAAAAILRSWIGNAG